MGSTTVPSSLPPDLTALLARLATEWLFDPQRTRIFEQASRALSAHVAEYRQCLVAKGDTPKHIRETIQQLRVMLHLIGLELARQSGRSGVPVGRYSQLSPSLIQVALSKLQIVRRHGIRRGKNLGLRSCNAYLHSLKSFCNWMVNDYRADRTPCRSVKPFNAALDVRRARQAFCLEQALRLIKAAKDGAPMRGITGAERAMSYVMYITTGLRAAELESLCDTSFHLGVLPEVRVEAAYSKHRRRDVIPLRGDVCEMLASYLASCGRQSKVFRRPAGDCTLCLRADLQAAGLPYVDASGAYADHHALRHTFISELFRAGCTPKEGQTLARHSDPRLTLSKYCHVTAPELRGAVERSWAPRAFETARSESTETAQRGPLG